MDKITDLPDKRIAFRGPVSGKFLELGVESFAKACRHVHEMPYGYNSDRDEPMILFKENRGSCTTKHAVVTALARELGLPVTKKIGVYPMTEDIVTGAGRILEKYGLPYLPMLHCFLAYENFRVDLTEGNRNGKNRSIETFLHVEKVPGDISAKDEYLLYRKALKERVLNRPEMEGVDIKSVLHAREEGIALLKANIGQ